MKNADGRDMPRGPIARLLRLWIRAKLVWYAEGFRLRGKPWQAHECDLLRASIRKIDHPDVEAP